MSISNYAEAAILNAIGNNTSFVVTQVYAKLHTAVEATIGEDGANSAAAEATRVAVSFGAAANPGGTMQNDAAVTWTNVSTTETYRGISLWDTVGPAGGNCLWVGSLDADHPVTAGDTFTIATNNLTLTLS